MLESTGSGDADRICALLLSLGEALSRAGRSSEAKEVLRRAATLAERTGRTDRLARAAVEYGGRFAWSRASTDQFLVPLLERALAAIDEADSAERVKLLARLATATRDDPSRARRVRIAEEAVQIARRLDDPETLAFALEGHWTAVEGPDTAGGGIEPGAMLVKLGEQTGDKERALEWLLSMTLLADVCATVEDQDAAARLHALLAPYEGLYTVAPVEATFGSVARALGVVASVLERFDAAERHFAFAIETERKMKARPWRAHAQHNLAAMLLRRGAVGDDERALALLDEARDNYRELGMKSWAARASEATGASRSRP